MARTVKSVFGDVTEEEHYAAVGVVCNMGFISAPRGVKLFTRSWSAKDKKPRALVFMCHGYGNNISWNLQLCALRFVAAGLDVHALDAQGHGNSEGLHGYIPSFDNIVMDYCAFFDQVKARPEYAGLKSFLYGESMGGASALLIGRRQPGAWAGAILSAPMCKISEKLKPPAIVIAGLSFLGDIIPQAPIVPTKSLVDASFSDPVKRELARQNPRAYLGQPRIRSALQLLYTSQDLEAHLDQVQIPFLVLHGLADVVTDPDISRELYAKASSSDKTLKLYEGFCHALLVGETDENVEVVYKDVFEWLEARI